MLLDVYEGGRCGRTEFSGLQDTIELRVERIHTPSKALRRQPRLRGAEIADGLAIAKNRSECVGFQSGSSDTHVGRTKESKMMFPR